MAKKKIMKEDGITEDFDAEALEPDEAESSDAKPAGDMSELLPPKDDAEGKSDEGAKSDEAALPPLTTPGEPAAASEDKGPAEAPKADEGKASADVTEAGASASDSAASTSGGSDKAKDATDSSVSSAPASNATATAEATADAPADVPVLAEPHPEAQAAVDLDPAVMDAFKEAGNLLTPALKKLGEYSEKIHELEDEAKNRFAAMRQKATECVAALEAIFKRD